MVVLINYVSNSSLHPILIKHSVDVMLRSNKELWSPRRKLTAQGAAHQCSESSVIQLCNPGTPTLGVD